MRLVRTVHFDRSYSKAPARIRQAFDKQSLLLRPEPAASFSARQKYSEAENKWQARVNQDWRFYFRIAGDTYIVTEIVPHPK